METITDTSYALIGHPIISITAIVFSYLCISTFLSYQRLSYIPGPPVAALTQLWLARATSKGSLYITLGKVLDQYGSPARIAPNMIVFNDPEIYRAAVAARSSYRRGAWYKGMQLDPRINNLLSERNEKRHTDLRSKMLHAYTGKDVPEMESMIDERVLDLVNLIQEEGVDHSKVVDFARMAQYFTLDSLTHIAFGQPLGFLIENRDLYEYNASSTAFFPILAMGASVPVVGDILKSRLIQSFAGPKAEDKSGLGAIVGWARQRVGDRFANQSVQEKGRTDMLDSFIKHGLTQLEAESESLLQILAGSDSTATGLRMTMLYLLTNPPVYSKLRAETDASVSGQTTSIVSSSQTSQLPYLQAVIKESLRIWQPLTGIATKLPPPEGIIINGLKVPGGTQLALAIQSLSTKEDIFGDDARLFRPERWIDSEPETLKAYEKAWELTFAGGRFTCPGKNIALMEISKVVFELLKRFDFGLADPVHTMDSENHQLFVQRNMKVRVSQRLA